MKVLFVSSSNGDSVRTIKYLQSYVRFGHEIVHIGWDRKKLDPPVTVKNGVRHQAIFRGGGYGNALLVFALPIWTFRLILCLLRERFDLVHVADFDAALGVALGSIFRRRPFIYDIYDTFALRHNYPGPVVRILTAMDHWVMRRAAAVIIVDENRQVSIPSDISEKVQVIYNCPSDIESLKETDSEIIYDIVASGHLAKYRGVNLLLEAAQRMPDLRIVMAGRINDPDLESAIRACPQIVFRGWLPQEDVLVLCRQSRVVYSLYDPATEINRRAASNKWYDAMMAGRPVLTNIEVMNSERIREWDIGYLIPYGAVDALVDVLTHIRVHPEEADKKGQRGRVLFDTKFNWTLMEQRLVAILDAAVPSTNCEP